ncbi:hypothetical protein [Novosphingobium album (ex Liu et al. 2023)]|uniref:Uncharacterized protein n=1 Tax=Novosphingobium album (ex Liu et al. 2023) TaxID=3031130 RepID=A0ABT5WQQ6_9SPHN|nr:hypothetical protein [Novosphingobium album (ex Liu et al. 2023)]MDE8652373.1 hypothetical protein [Novosphingobium album (ex Liu et al. 2023)]
MAALTEAIALLDDVGLAIAAAHVAAAMACVIRAQAEAARTGGGFQEEPGSKNT